MIDEKKNILRRIIAFILGLVMIAFVLCACQDKSISPSETDDVNDFSHEEKVRVIMAEMTLEEMIYQMMFVTCESITEKDKADDLKNALKEHPVGGIVYFAPNLKTREQTIMMIKNAQESSEIPLFIGVDEEGGVVSRLGDNPLMETTSLPQMKKIGDEGDVNKAFDVGKILSSDLLSLGFNVDFAPVADVLVNDKNTEIGSRSFGKDPQNVALMVENVVKGMEENGLSSTLKHFPGHGSTFLNSHSGYSESQRTLNEMRNCEFLPFISGIKAGADFVMISHMTPVNAIKEKLPASISKEIITDILIEELGFEGIVITDSFSMGAITENFSPSFAAISAVKAGADMILMPPKPAETVDYLLGAVSSGEISRERIEKSVRKIISLKVEKKMTESLK